MHDRKLPSAGYGSGQGVGGGAAQPGPDAGGKAVGKGTGTGNNIYSEVGFITPNNPDKGRTSVGVGETVTFYAEAADGSSLDGKWTGTAVGAIGAAGGANQMAWTAPSTAGTFVATWTPTDGTAVTTISMSIVAPTLKFTKTSERSYASGQGAGMICAVTFQPLTVSFAAAQWQESNVPASNIKGFYATANPPPPQHVAAPAAGFNNDNTGPSDIAEFFGATGTLTAGSFDWVIPQAYVLAGKSISLGTITQSCVMVDGGTTTVTKADQSSAPRAPT